MASPIMDGHANGNANGHPNGHTGHYEPRNGHHEARDEYSDEEDESDDWDVARKAVELALNNRVDEAHRILKDNQGRSVQLQAGFCYLTFMNAVMTFEDEKMTLALSTLKATEKRCTSGVPWSQAETSRMPWSPSLASFQSVKHRVQGMLNTREQASRGEARSEFVHRLEQQIVAADCQILASVLNFLHQDWGSYMKGGWVLRKAWKIYQKAYVQIRQMYMKKIGLSGNTLAPPLPPNTTDPVTPSCACKPTGGVKAKGGVSQSFSVPINLFSIMNGQTQKETKLISSPICDSPSCPSTLPDSPTIKRLMSSVSFGYGIFHLAVSLLPPKILNIIHFLGFEGDRQTGIQALHFARQGNDMRGPLATLALLWYHTIVRPFFGLDGSNTRSGADAAQRLIDGSKPQFQESALFLFFQGRVDRLKSNFLGALSSYEHALAVSAQREIRLLCLHEVGWSYVLLLHWEKSSKAFLQLKRESRWSKGFYCYLSSVCLGSKGDLDSCLRLAQETPSLIRQPPANQLERFLLRRANKMNADAKVVDQQYCLLLAYELLYLWNALGASLKHSCSSIIGDCERMTVPALEGVRQLILGNILSDMGQRMGEVRQCYGLAMKQGELQGDIHTAAFAAYELGMLLCKNKESRNEGRHYLEYARDNYQGYDFENRLNVRIHSALHCYPHITAESDEV